MKRSVGGWAWLLVGGSLLLTGCGLHGKKATERTAKVGAAATLAPSDASRVVAAGIVESWGGDVDLSPQESGWIAKIDVKEGDRVDSGQLLAALDDSKERAALDLAQAELREAEAALGKALHGPTRDEVRTVEAEAESNRANATLAEREAKRVAALGEAGVTPQAEVERSAFDARARAALARASEARSSLVKRGARAEDREALRSRVAAAKARVELARANLARRRVTAPRAGTVLLSRYHVGELFNASGAAMFVIGETSKLQVRLEVDEIDSSRVAESARVSIVGDDNVPITEGSVLRLAPRMGRRGLAIESPTSRADVRVREVFVEVPKSSLIPGQRVWGYVAVRVTPAS